MQGWPFGESCCVDVEHRILEAKGLLAMLSESSCALLAGVQGSAKLFRQRSSLSFPGRPAELVRHRLEATGSSQESLPVAW